MYAIVEIAGKQFRVSKEMKLRVPRLDSEAGKKIGFDQVLLVDDGKGKTTVGNPIVKNMLVNATVISHERDKKVIVFKKKRRKGYQKKQGHRQGYSIIEINTIGSGTLKEEARPAKTKAETGKAASGPKEAKAAPAVKKAPAKTAAKKPAAKAGAATAAKQTKPPAKKAAPKKAAAKKETKPAAVKKAADKEDKKEE